MQNFVRFHPIESEIKLSWEFWGKRNSNVPYRATCTQIASLFFLIIYILYTNFCAILSTINRDMLMPKISRKSYDSATCWQIFSKNRQRAIYARISLITKFHEILCISSWVTKFLSQTDTQADRQTFCRNSQIVFRTSQNV